jgi:dimethylsulfoniopropionate demethylase
MPPVLSRSRRTRRTPFSDRVEAQGVKAYTVYNHMLLPTVFESLEADYHHLKRQVQLWDVSCERQVQVRGPDAQRLVQLLTPRDLSGMSVGQCFYTPMVDETGGMLNDPVTLKLAEDRYWISIADSDLLLWVKGLANGMRLDAAVDEPDVSPLAVQGPRADDLMAAVFGEDIRSLRFFRFREVKLDGQTLIVARSGYSKQGGFEVYLQDSSFGGALWDKLFEAGQAFQVRAGCPNLIERIEGGLLSYGNDMTRENTPHECGLGRFCQTADAIGCIGRDALIRASMEGPQRMIRGLRIAGEALTPPTQPWAIHADDQWVGQVTSAVWSPDFRCNVAIGMLELGWWDEGSVVEVETPFGNRQATVSQLNFS